MTTSSETSSQRPASSARSSLARTRRRTGGRYTQIRIHRGGFKDAFSLRCASSIALLMNCTSRR